jgi:hypothetical protein
MKNESDFYMVDPKPKRGISLGSTRVSPNSTQIGFNPNATAGAGGFDFK